MSGKKSVLIQVIRALVDLNHTEDRDLISGKNESLLIPDFGIVLSSCITELHDDFKVKLIVIKEFYQKVDSLVRFNSQVDIMYILEKNPVGLYNVERTSYPFALMEVGDSFLIEDYRKAESARIAAIQFCKRNRKPWKFTQRKTDLGWRIIRIA